MNTKKGGAGGKQQGAFKTIQSEKAKVKLSQVSRDAKIKMKFLAIELKAELVNNFKNDSIKINKIKDSENVNFTVLNRDTTKGQIELLL